MQWLQHTNQSIVDNLNNVKREATTHIRNKRKEYLKAKIDELETNSKLKNIRHLYTGISGFKKGFLPRTNVVKDEKGDLFTDCRSILAMWWNYFCQLLNVHGVNDVRPRKIHTAEPLVPELSAVTLR
jgi:hypothetical protein